MHPFTVVTRHALTAHSGQKPQLPISKEHSRNCLTIECMNELKVGRRSNSHFLVEHDIASMHANVIHIIYCIMHVPPPLPIAAWHCLLFRKRKAPDSNTADSRLSVSVSVE